MAAQDQSQAAASGVDQGDVRRRHGAGQPNGSYIPKELDEKMDEKTKEKVRDHTASTTSAAYE